MTMTIERKQQILDYHMRPVTLKRMENRNGELGLYTFDEESKRQIAPVSSRYELVQNREVLAPVIDRLGIDSLVAAYKGPSGFYLWKFETGRTIKIAEGDVFKEQIVMMNSYNKTRSFRIMAGAFRMICSNGLYAGQVDISFRKIHVGNIPAADIVTRGLDAITRYNYDAWHNMAATPTTLERELAALERFQAVEEEPAKEVPCYGGGTRLVKPPAYYTNSDVRHYAKVILNRAESVNNARTAWGFYNALNSSLASTMRGRTERYTRAITANKRAEEFVMAVLPVLGATSSQPSVPFNPSSN